MNFNNTKWHRAGRVSVKSGAAVVKGIDTDWLLAEIKAGDIFTIDGSQLYEIESVASSTELNLKTRFAGDSVESNSYAIIQRTHAVMQAEIAARLAALIDEWDAHDAKQTERIENFINVWGAQVGLIEDAANSIYRTVTLTANRDLWMPTEEGISSYAYYADVANDLITADMTPVVTILPSSAQLAGDAEMSQFAFTFDKKLRVFAQKMPDGDIILSVLLLGAKIASSGDDNSGDDNNSGNENGNDNTNTNGDDLGLVTKEEVDDMTDHMFD